MRSRSLIECCRAAKLPTCQRLKFHWGEANIDALIFWLQDAEKVGQLGPVQHISSTSRFAVKKSLLMTELTIVYDCHNMSQYYKLVQLQIEITYEDEQKVKVNQ